MRIIASIDQASVIAKLVIYLGLWPASAHTPPESIAA
jgi:hypothetical protein